MENGRTPGVVSGAPERRGKPKVEPAEAEVEDVLEETDDTGDYRTVTWQGTTYKYNDHLSNFLFLGIDTREKAETETGSADAGQSDALYLISWDRVDNQVTLISIPPRHHDAHRSI